MRRKNLRLLKSTLTIRLLQLMLNMWMMMLW